MNFTARLAGSIVAAGLASIAGLQPVSAAAAGNTQQTVPAPAILNPCNGELVLTTGSLHTATYVHGHHLLIRENFQGVKGVGSVTGLRYVVTGSSQSHGNFNRKGQTEFTTVMHLHLVAPGTGQNFFTTLVFHNTLTPSGHISVKVHSRQHCATPRVATHVAHASSAAAPGHTAGAGPARPRTRATGR